MFILLLCLVMMGTGRWWTGYPDGPVTDQGRRGLTITTKTELLIIVPYSPAVTVLCTTVLVGRLSYTHEISPNELGQQLQRAGHFMLPPLSHCSSLNPCVHQQWRPSAQIKRNQAMSYSTMLLEAPLWTRDFRKRSHSDVYPEVGPHKSSNHEISE